MDEVKVEKATLLAKLKENRETHIQLYKDAMEGFFIDNIKRTEKLLEQLKANKIPKYGVNPNPPVNHESQYDEAIAMLEMSVDSQVKLSRHEFSQYVQDTWVSATEKNMMRAMALSSSNSAMYR